MLPEPKSEMFIKKPATTFLPNILNKTTPKPIMKPANKNINLGQKSTLINNYNSSDSDLSDSEEKPADFFSLNKDLKPVDIPLQPDVNDVTNKIPSNFSGDIKSDLNPEYYQETIPSEDLPHTSETISYSATLDDEAVSFFVKNLHNHFIDLFFLNDCS